MIFKAIIAFLFVAITFYCVPTMVKLAKAAGWVGGKRLLSYFVCGSMSLVALLLIVNIF